MKFTAVNKYPEKITISSARGSEVLEKEVNNSIKNNYKVKRTNVCIDFFFLLKTFSSQQRHRLLFVFDFEQSPLGKR